MLEQEESLRKLEAENQDFITRIKHLQQLKEILDSTDLQDLEQEVEKKKIDGLSKLEAFWETSNKVKSFLEKEVEALDNKVKANAEKIKLFMDRLTGISSLEIEKVGQALEKISSSIGDLEQNYNQKLEEYQKYVDKLTGIFDQIKQVEEVNLKNIDIYSKHFKENKEIWGNLESPANLVKVVEDISGEMEKMLKTFDEEIRVLIGKKEKISVAHINT